MTHEKSFRPDFIPPSEGQTFEGERILTREEALWLAGLFEAKGSLRYQIRRASAHPEMSISHMNVEGLQTLQRFGGTILRKKQTSTWIMSGRAVINLAMQMSPYSPSQKKFMTLANMWDNLEPDEKIEAVELFKGRPKRTFDNLLQRYTNLIKEPPFCAGVTDAIGHPHTIDESPGFHLTTNQQVPLLLLEVMHQQYGGTFDGQHTALYIKSTQAQELYTLINPYLIISAEKAKNLFE